MCVCVCHQSGRSRSGHPLFRLEQYHLPNLRLTLINLQLCNKLPETFVSHSSLGHALLLRMSSFLYGRHVHVHVRSFQTPPITDFPAALHKFPCRKCRIIKVRFGRNPCCFVTYVSALKSLTSHLNTMCYISL